MVNLPKPDIAKGETKKSIKRLKKALSKGDAAQVAICAAALLQVARDDVDLMKSLGSTLFAKGYFREAESFLDRALRNAPRDPDLLSSVGCVSSELGKNREADDAFRKSVELAPRRSLTRSNYGNHLLRVGDLIQAGEQFQVAIRIDARNVTALSGLGAILIDQGDLDRAETMLRQALAIDPSSLVTQRRLIFLFGKLGDGSAAFDALTRLTPKQRDDAFLIKQIANLLCYQHEYEKAIQCCDWLSDLDEDDPESLIILADIFSVLEKPTESAICFSRVLEIDPEHHAVRSRLIHNFCLTCDWEQAAALSGPLEVAIKREVVPVVVPFALASLDGFSAVDIHRVAAAYAKDHIGPISGVFEVGDKRKTKARLRIGYMSADFRHHPVAYLVTGVLEAHDRTQFEVFGYSHGVQDGGDVRSRIVEACDVFRDLRNDPSDVMADVIRRDEIDILVDLTGWTQGGRMLVLAQRPAPIQVNWLGYPGTLGSRQLADYIVGDPVVTPLESADAYAEWLALMPHCLQANDPKRMIGPKPTRAAAGLPESGIVFCSFNQPYKITPAVFSVWCRILSAVPGSVLWLHKFSDAAMSNLCAAAERHGVAASRLVFANRAATTADHLGRLQLADIALDTFPYTSHTTGSDALWVGVPLVTRMGDTFASRVAASLLFAVGLDSLVVDSAEKYVDAVVALATDASRCLEIKEHLLTNRMSLPLFDGQAFVRDLESLYLRMWKDHEAGIKRHLLPFERRATA